jgi:hypothetical protein
LIQRVPLGAALFFALLTVSLIVAVLAVRARSPDLVLEVTHGLPVEIGRGEEAEFEFFVREDEPEARIAIVDSEEDVVRTLDQRVALERGEEIAYGWDGEDDEGEPVAPGRYRLLVEVPASDRTMIWPKRITVGHPPPLLPPEAE